MVAICLSAKRHLRISLAGSVDWRRPFKRCFAAAGNDAVNLPHYPSAYPGAISVAATDASDNPASFSNYGTTIDIAAPGVSILSTVLGSSYGYKSGTSMATPHAAGLAALLWSEFPTYSASEIERLLYQSAVDLGGPGRDDYFGHGRINASDIF